MSKVPLVSVIVPVYNAERFLGACISSIIAQTHVNIEIILIDDGATDNSGTICDEFATTDTRIKVIHQANGGIAAAQNTGLDVMTGDYVTFCDCDDLLHPQYIQILLHLLQTADADISTCRWYNVGASNVSATLNDAPNYNLPDIHSITYNNALSSYQNVFSVLSRKFRKNGEYRYLNEANWSKLYVATLFDGVRFPDGHFAQDMWVSADIYPQAHKIAATLLPLYIWVQHQGSTSHANKSLNYHQDIFNTALRNFTVSLENNVVPLRSWYSLCLEYKKYLNKSNVPENMRKIVRNQFKTAQSKLTLSQLTNCNLQRYIRTFETFIYNHTKHIQR